MIFAFYSVESVLFGGLLMLDITVLKSKKNIFIYFRVGNQEDEMEYPVRYRVIIPVIFSLILFHSCLKKEPPAVITGEISDITSSSATCTGTVISEGSSSLYTRGVCWSTDPEPTVDNEFTNTGKGLGTYASTMTRLNGSTRYYVRAYATNRDGTGYGDEIFFHTAPRDIVFNQSLTYGTMTDQDGNEYRTIQIGQQTWMAQNLRAVNYTDGSEIPNITDAVQWSGLTSGACCYYENDTINRSIYGLLYNWYAVADTRKICPDGWHVPTDAEFTILEEYLGGTNYAGMKMKEVSQVHWASPNLGATNESGFTAVPGGSRNWSFQFDFRHLGYYSVFWTSTGLHADGQNAYCRYLYSNSVEAARSTWNKTAGFSVRCVKD